MLVLTPIAAGAGDGYYASRTFVLNTAGQEQFDAEARLDPDALVADELVVQDVLDRADLLVDTLGLAIGLAATVANPPHVVDATESYYGPLRLWASRWARAELHLMRGEPGGDIPVDVINAPPDSALAPEGRFRKMKNEAERWIAKLLQAKYAVLRSDARTAGGLDVPAVGHSSCATPAGWDPRFGGPGVGL